jgi:hypothetical protein
MNLDPTFADFDLALQRNVITNDKERKKARKGKERKDKNEIRKDEDLLENFINVDGITVCIKHFLLLYDSCHSTSENRGKLFKGNANN